MNSKLPSQSFQPKIGARGYQADLLDDALADLREEHIAVGGIPGKVLGITSAIGVDLSQSGVVAVVWRTDCQQGSRTRRWRCWTRAGRYA